MCCNIQADLQAVKTGVVIFQADIQAVKTGVGKPGERLEKAAELLMGCFRVCASDK